MNKPSYADYLRQRYNISPEGALTDFVSRHDGRLLLGDQVDLTALAQRYGAPLEVAYLPLVTAQVDHMRDWADAARADIGYTGRFLYAYATKANFAEEVVRTALAAGAHYETSAAADVTIAHMLWRQGLLDDSRYIFCNGSKEPNYLDAIVALRQAGCARVVTVLDDLDELDQLMARTQLPLLLGVRERHAAAVVDPNHPGGERFGLLPEEIAKVVAKLRGTPHRLVVYHAMVGSQMEHADTWITRLERSAVSYARLRRLVPSLTIFNFGGGMPTTGYALDFQFDYQAFLTRLMDRMAQVCAAHQVPQPDLVGEFGRYTCANHSVFLLEIGAVKAGQAGAPDWHLVNGSLMVSLPDILIVEGQQFVMLPLEGWEAEAKPAVLGGRRSCDSDDFFPRPGQEQLLLPDVGAGQVLAVFGVGAYQQMIGGRGGAHHCLSPEMRRIVIERDGDVLVVREVAQQSLGQIMGHLGYRAETLELARPKRAARRPMAAAARRRYGVRAA